MFLFKHDPITVCLHGVFSMQQLLVTKLVALRWNSLTNINLERS
jgi:hypothetical protein